MSRVLQRLPKNSESLKSLTVLWACEWNDFFPLTHTAILSSFIKCAQNAGKEFLL